MLAGVDSDRQLAHMLFRTHLRAHLAAALLLCSIVSACGDRASRATDSALATRAPIADTAKGPGVRDGTWQGPDAQSTWHAILDGPAITQIDEVSLATDGTMATRQFAFDSTGLLAKLREERVQKVYGNAATPDTVNTLIELEWQGDSLVRSAKRVNNADKLLQPFEVDNLRAHAIDLARTARIGSTTAKPAR